MRSNLLPIAKEGLNYIAGAILFFIAFWILGLDFLQFFAFLTIIFLVFVFRNPEREIINFQNDSVVSPVDGLVSSIEELSSGDYAYKVEIDSSYFNVALLRAPLTSSIENIEMYKGARVSAYNSLSKNINENTVIIFSDKNENSVKIIHRLKQSFTGIKIDAIKSQNLFQGSRYGLIVNGITTLYLPQNFRLNVNIGGELVASETLIGYFTNEKKA